MMIYDRVALIGLGLIASSMGHAIKAAGLANAVGFDTDASVRQVARDVGFCTVVDSLAEAVAGADLVVLAVPVGAMGDVAAAMAPHLKPGATVTDVGSVKQAVIAAVAPHIPTGVHFVPGHPLAGTEYSGPRAGFATLFQDRWCLLIDDGADADALSRLRTFWEGMGANVDVMDAAHHDVVMAVVSHTPHLIAYTMVGVAEHVRRVSDSEIVKYSASGFRDFTRIASSDPTMWRDIFLTNKDAVLDILGRFSEELFALQRAIRIGDGNHLHDYFTRTRAIRRGIVEARQDTAAPNFGRGGERG
ncbi:prephenate/arogenate dehydrogenase family protein [Falsirhodobacter halotolerans]|uniref:prephenate/arogenate dehydrogenase family protein n=1 Tax=Falsirhodobacter halotolerans TaxID=1146892 RepID=UPI001FD1C7FD|nr:prephenate/arogenate dehydrogenase family protein [Falsirhodobacter halotolerans]MCJ8138713.1 prephenate/arogenate dehydrogenase family protein [Falsirhodobacter halotolerans]